MMPTPVQTPMSYQSQELKARAEMWRAITKLLEWAFELLVEEAERKRKL